MAEIIGYQKFHSKKKDQDYIRLFFTWADDSVKGLMCDSTICSPDYFSRIKSNEDNLRVGYDKEKKSRFLYIGR